MAKKNAVVTEKQPLYDADLESKIIGGILGTPNTYADGELVSAFQLCKGVLNPNHFWDIRHRFIYEAMGEIEGDLIDVTTVGARLQSISHDSANRLSAIGGKAYLLELSVYHAPIPFEHLLIYAEMVKKLAYRRAVFDRLNQGVQLVFDFERPIEYLTDEIAAGIIDVQETFEQSHNVMRSLLEVSDELEYLDRSQQYLSSGFDVLDRVLGGGIPSGAFIALGAPTGAGKTSFALELVRAGFEDDHQSKTLFFSLEMNRYQILERLRTQVTGVPTWKVIHNKLTADDKAALAAFEADNQFDYMRIHDGRITLTQLIKHCRNAYKAYNRLDYVVIDYLNPQWIKLYDEHSSPDEIRHFRTMNDKQIVDHIISELLLLQKDLPKLRILVVTQFNRQTVLSGELSLYGFANSSGIENAATLALLLGKDKNGQYELTIAKNRYGISIMHDDNAKIIFNFIPTLTRFEEVH